MAASDPVDRFVEDLFNTVSQQSEALLSQHYPVLASKIMPLAILAGMVWLALKVIRVHAGKDPSDVWPWIRALLTLVFVFWGLTWGAGGTKIFHSFTELRDDTVSIFMGGKSIVEYTEFAYDKFSAVAAHLMTASWMNIGIILLGELVQLLDCLIVIVVLLLKVGSEMGLAITMVLGPLFLPTLMWDNTRSYGMSWFSAMLKFALVGVLLGVCVVFSFGICELFMGSAGASATSGLLNIAPAKVEARQVSACIILELFMLLFLAFGVRPLASALASSGAAGGGLAEMAAGFALSQIMSKLTGGKGGGQTPNSLTNISNTQASQGKQLDRIESGLSSGGGQGSPSGSGEPSGAGQPGGPGSGSGSGDAGGTGQSSESDGAKW
jgi:type IV secretion system protein VirB6